MNGALDFETRYPRAFQPSLTFIFHLIQYPGMRRKLSQWSAATSFPSHGSQPEETLFVDSEAKGTEHEAILTLPDDGRCGSVCPAPFRGEEGDLM